jgi:hypothetical protein
MNMNKRLLSISYVLGTLLLLVSAVLVMEHVRYGTYLFAIGASLVILNKLWNQYRGDDFRLKRLNRYNLFSAILLVGCSYMQFHDMNSWVILLLLVAILELFVSLRTSSYEKAIEAEKKDMPASDQQNKPDVGE